MMKNVYLICVFFTQSIIACEVYKPVHFCEYEYGYIITSQIPSDLYEQVESLIEAVEKGEKKREDLNKEITCVGIGFLYQRKPLIALARHKYQKSIALLRQLLEMGANPHVKEEWGELETPLKSAIKYGCPCSVELLLDHGANAYEHSYMLQELIQMHRSMGSYDSEQQYALMQERIRQNADLLVRYKADVNYSNKYCRHVLHGLVDDYNYFTREGYAPGKEAEARFTTRFLIKLFLENGANPYKRWELRDKSLSLNAIEYAQEKKLLALVQHFARSFGIYWITRLLSNGIKEDKALSYGPFPRDIARLIAQYRFHYFVDSFMPLKK